MRNSSSRLGLAATVLGLVVGAVSPSRATMVVDLGTGNPPATLGGFSMTPIADDGAVRDAMLTSIPAPNLPGGDLTFSTFVQKKFLGNGWNTWSNNDPGGSPVYFASSVLTSLTLTLPSNTDAFSFYIEPNFVVPNSPVVVSFTTNDGATGSHTFTSWVNSAAGFGIYQNDATPLTSITLTLDSNALGWGLGEFGISGTAPIEPTAVPEPATLTAAGLGVVMALAYAWRRKAKAAA